MSEEANRKDSHCRERLRQQPDLSNRHYEREVGERHRHIRDKVDQRSFVFSRDPWLRGIHG